MQTSFFQTFALKDFFKFASERKMQTSNINMFTYCNNSDAKVFLSDVCLAGNLIKQASENITGTTALIGDSVIFSIRFVLKISKS